MADAAADSESWFESALRHAEPAAHQIARFRNPWWNPTWRDLVPDDTSPAHRAFTAGWGLRGKRSRPAAARFVKGEAASACSPATPFDFGSGSAGAPSTSGGETSSPEKAADAGGKRRRVGDGGDVSAAGGGCERMVVGTERPPFVFRISAAKDISRRTGKKKTLCELQEEEKLLMEEKKQLKKEMELRMKAYDKLWMENQMLKSRQRGNFRGLTVSREFEALEKQNEEFLPPNGVEVVNTAERAYKAATAGASSAVPSSSTGFFLPDLNEPLSENLN